MSAAAGVCCVRRPSRAAGRFGAGERAARRGGGYARREAMRGEEGRPRRRRRRGEEGEQQRPPAALHGLFSKDGTRTVTRSARKYTLVPAPARAEPRCSYAAYAPMQLHGIWPYAPRCSYAAYAPILAGLLWPPPSRRGAAEGGLALLAPGICPFGGQRREAAAGVTCHGAEKLHQARSAMSGHPARHQHHAHTTMPDDTLYLFGGDQCVPRAGAGAGAPPLPVSWRASADAAPAGPGTRPSGSPRTTRSAAAPATRT